MKIFLRILLAIVALLGVSCVGHPLGGPRRGGPPMGGPGGHGVQGQGGQWYRTADTYSHKRVAYNRKTGETKIINMGDVPNNDPGLLADARENGYRVLQKGESERVSPDQVPEHIRRKIAALPREGGNSRFGGVVPTRGGRPQGGYQPAPPCNGGYCPSQGGPQQPQRGPRYDSFGRIPEYDSRIPKGMKAWDAHQRGYW